MREFRQRTGRPPRRDPRGRDGVGEEAPADDGVRLQFVLARVFGGNDDLFDRRVEQRIFNAVGRAGLGPRLLVRSRPPSRLLALQTGAKVYWACTSHHVVYELHRYDPLGPCARRYHSTMAGWRSSCLIKASMLIPCEAHPLLRA